MALDETTGTSCWTSSLPSTLKNETTYSLDVEFLARDVNFVREQRDDQMLSWAYDQVARANGEEVAPHLLKQLPHFEFRGEWL